MKAQIRYSNGQTRTDIQIVRTTKRINEEDCEEFSLVHSSRISAGTGYVSFAGKVRSSAKSRCIGHRNYGEEVRVLHLTSSREARN